MKFKNISLNQIDRNDLLFFAENKNVAAFESQKIDELFNPVWLQKKEDGSFRIIDGFLIIPGIVKARKTTSIPARLFEADADLESLWILRVKKRITEDNLSPIGLLQSLSKLLETIKKSEPAEDIQTLIGGFGFPTKGLQRTQLAAILKALTETCQFCDLPFLSYREIYSISRRNNDELEAFAVLLKGLKLKGKKLQSMLQLLDELAKGYQLSPQEIIRRKETLHIINETPTHLKYKVLKSYLSLLRWPVLDKTKKKWRQSVKDFNRPGALTITTDPMFESNYLEFGFKASDLSEFNDILSTLSSYSDRDDFARLFDFV